MIKANKKAQVILFNNNDMKCYTLNRFEVESPSMFNSSDNYQPIQFYGTSDISGDIREKIELDNKTMKQIAKYNAEVDVEILIRKKQLIEDEIRLFQERKKIEENKFKELSKFTNEFLKANEQTIEEYIDEQYKNNNDYDYFD